MSIDSDLTPYVNEILHDHVPGAKPMTGLLTRFNARIARYGMYFSVTGLLLIVLTVAYQVFGRYVLNNPPTWAESLALLLILYVTLIAAAVGVRDAGHIGMESLLVLAPERIRQRVEIVIHILVALFGVGMAYNGTLLGYSVMNYKISGLPITEAARYIPLIISGVLVVLFSLEHIIALFKNAEVTPSWH